MLPRTYTGSYSGEKGRQFLQEPYMLALAKSFEIFIMVSISDMPAIKYWHNLGTFLDKAKEKIHEQFIIGDTCFMSLVTIGGDFFTIHSNNLNHVHEDSNDILSVIIILGTYFHGGKNNLIE